MTKKIIKDQGASGSQKMTIKTIGTPKMSGKFKNNGKGQTDETTNQIIKQAQEEIKARLINYLSVDECKYEFSKFDEIVDQAITQAVEEAYVKGFKDGFDHSAEGYNGEYIHPSLRKKGFMDKKLTKNALDKLTK